MRAIDNAYRAVAGAMAEGIDLRHLAVTAWRKADVARLGREVVRALGERDPELEVDDIYPEANIGTVAELAKARCVTIHWFIDAEDASTCENEFVDLIRRVAETLDDKFLQQARKQVHAAINLSLAARLDCVRLEDRYRKTPIEPALSLVTEVTDYYRDFKQQCGMIDVADILAGELEPVPGCKLVLIAGHLPKLAKQSLRRIFPQAFFCTCSLG